MNNSKVQFKYNDYGTHEEQMFVSLLEQSDLEYNAVKEVEENFSMKDAFFGEEGSQKTDLVTPCVPMKE